MVFFFPFYYKRVKQIGSTFYFRKWFFIASLKKIMTNHEYLWLSLIRITATTIPNYFRLTIIEMPFLNTFFRFWVSNTGAYPFVLYNIPFHCYNSVRYITLGLRWSQSSLAIWWCPWLSCVQRLYFALQSDFEIRRVLYQISVFITATDRCLSKIGT